MIRYMLHSDHQTVLMSFALHPRDSRHEIAYPDWIPHMLEPNKHRVSEKICPPNSLGCIRHLYISQISAPINQMQIYKRTC